MSKIRDEVRKFVDSLVTPNNERGGRLMDGLGTYRYPYTIPVDRGMAPFTLEETKFMADALTIAPINSISMGGIYPDYTCSFSQAGITLILNALSNNPHIKDIQFSGYDLRSKAYKDIVDTIATAIAEKFVNKIVRIRNCFFNPDGAAAITDAMSRTSASTINLEGNQFGSESSTLIANVLTNTSAPTVDLSHTTLDATGAKIIGEALGKTLAQTVVLTGCFREGAEPIANGLANTSALTVVLSNNYFGPTGAKFVGEALRKTLAQTIILDGCRFGLEGAAPIAQGLARTKVRNVNIRQNFEQFDRTGMIPISIQDRVIADAILESDNQYLESIDGLSEESNKALANLFERNRARREKAEQDAIQAVLKLPQQEGPSAIVMDYTRKRTAPVAAGPAMAAGPVVRTAAQLAADKILLESAFNGDLKEFQAALKAGADANAVNKEGMNALEIIINRRDRVSLRPIFHTHDREMVENLLISRINLEHQHAGKTTRQLIAENHDRMDVQDVLQNYEKRLSDHRP